MPTAKPTQEERIASLERRLSLMIERSDEAYDDTEVVLQVLRLVINKWHAEITS